MSRTSPQLICTILFGIGLFGAVPTCLYAASEQDLNPNIAKPSIEVLALSRGRGVPENTIKAFQAIVEIANSALESDLVVSARQETIGLEGETRLCIVFRDDLALTTVGDEIRSLAANVDLLRVNENRCSGN